MSTLPFTFELDEEFTCYTNMARELDSKAVGSQLLHKPLSRRKSNPISSIPEFQSNCTSPALSLSEDLDLLSSQLTNQALLQLMVQASLAEQQQKQRSSNSGHRKLDRSHSEPVAPRPLIGNNALAGAIAAAVAASTNGANATSAINGNSSRYKTELCRPFEENGTCKYGDKCQFAHGFHELRSLSRHPKYKTELCRTFHTIGFCPYGPRCHFVHNAEEARAHNAKLSGHMPLSRAASSAQRTLPVNLTSPSPSALQRNPSGLTHFGTGSTADSPSPSSSLSESPTGSNSGFFNDDIFHSNSSNALPMSPGPIGSGPTTVKASTTASSFGFGTDFSAAFLKRQLQSNNLRQQYHSMGVGFPRRPLSDADSDDLLLAPNNSSSSMLSSFKLPGLQTPSPVDSLGSDLDSLSLSSESPPPPATVSSPMETSRNLRLPIFSRLSEGVTN